MNRTRTALAVLVAGFALFATACGGDDYTKADFQSDLEEKADLEPETAECVADGIEDAGIDISSLDSEGSFDEVFSDEDEEAFTEVTTNCVMEAEGIDPSDMTIPE